jgi:hypothetical protein
VRAFFCTCHPLKRVPSYSIISLNRAIYFLRYGFVRWKPKA